MKIEKIEIVYLEFIGIKTVSPVSSLEYLLSQGYMQLAAPITVEFELFDEETILRNKIKEINAQINQIRTEAMKRIDILKGKKQELLALKG